MASSKLKDEPDKKTEVEEPDPSPEEKQQDEDIFCTKCQKICASIFTSGEEVQHESLIIVSYQKDEEDHLAYFCEACTDNFYRFLYGQLPDAEQARLIMAFLKEDDGV